jgi:hypothetical protein
VAPVPGLEDEDLPPSCTNAAGVNSANSGRSEALPRSPPPLQPSIELGSVAKPRGRADALRTCVLDHVWLQQIQHSSIGLEAEHEPIVPRSRSLQTRWTSAAHLVLRPYVRRNELPSDDRPQRSDRAQVRSSSARGRYTPSQPRRCISFSVFARAVTRCLETTTAWRPTASHA